MFDGWEVRVVSRHEFSSVKKIKGFLETLKRDFSRHFPEHEERDQVYNYDWNK